MKYIPIKSDFNSFLNDFERYSNISSTQSFAERVSVSGDIAGSPFAHWRWKKKCIADIIIWPINEEELISILQLANKYQIPITPRGAGTGYYGSGVPAAGGILLDLKRMNKYTIDKKNDIVIAQTGTCFNTLIEALKEANYQLCSYPSSSLSSTLGGWIGTGGTTGVGTYKYGPFINQILQLKVITPNGELQIIDQKEKFELFFGTCGIFGVITEITMKIVPKHVEIPLLFGFDELTNIISIIKTLNSQQEILLIGFSDLQYELRGSGLNKYAYHLFIVLAPQKNEYSVIKNEVINLIEKNKGIYLGDEISNQNWENYLKTEMKLKLNTPILMLQSIYTDLNNCPEIVEQFQQLSEKKKLNHCYYGLVNKDMKVRLQLFTPTDNDKIVHFFASKGILHKMVKHLYKSKKGRVYTYGMLNSIYLSKYEKDKLKFWREKKILLDPNFILNPLKLIDIKTGFWRINLIFELNLFWRAIAVKINTAQIVKDIKADKIEIKNIVK